MMNGRPFSSRRIYICQHYYGILRIQAHFKIAIDSATTAVVAETLISIDCLHSEAICVTTKRVRHPGLLS